MVHTVTAVLSTSLECYMTRFLNVTWPARLKSRHKMALLSAIMQSGDCFQWCFVCVIEQTNFDSWLANEQKMSWLEIQPLAPLQVQVVETESELSVNFHISWHCMFQIPALFSFNCSRTTFERVAMSDSLVAVIHKARMLPITSPMSIKNRELVILSKQARESSEDAVAW